MHRTAEMHRRIAARYLSAETLTVVAAAAYISSTRYPDWSEEHRLVQERVLAMKKGDRSADRFFARRLATHSRLSAFDGIVTPAPRSAPDRPSNLSFAEALVGEGVGSRAVVSVQRIEPVESSRERRHRGLPGVDEGRHEETMGVPEHLRVERDTPFLIVDDVLTTGSTLKAVAATLRRAGFTGEILGAVAGYYVEDPQDVPDPLRTEVLRV